ncbi:MAG: biotin/lipoyl-containing protein, partial [Pelagibacteraceae bacterium]
MSSELKVPDIGDFKDVEIIEILVKEGQKVSKNDPLITLESDKSSVEVPSSLDGTIQQLNVKIGDKVSQGSIIGLIDDGSNKVDEKNNSEKKANVSDSNSQNFITVPDIGDFKNVEIIEVLVKEGDEINKGDPVITLESDKSSMEVPSDVSGKIISLKVKIGDKVSKGDILAELSGSKQIGQVEIKKEIPQNMQSNGQAQANQHQSETKRIEIKHEGVFGSNPDIADIDPEETDEWIESLNSVVKRDGSRRAHFLLSKLINQAYVSGSNLPFTQNTPYINTIPPQLETKSPGDQNIEKSIRSLIRWNAATMVVRANKISPELGGHIATFASAATLYDVGCNHFWRGKTNDFLGDMIYFQGHAAPGMYARSYLEGRISEQQLINFRQEANIKRGEGLSSYPHPWLMPDYWQFPTVSMGLGPITSIYNARFMKYMENRNLIPKQGRKIWTFMGDGECDEPESLGAIGLAARENLDNLIFVINCNLQRLDGPVRGNGKIIQELEGTFRGAGWN